MRIAISGAHCVGKSTLVEELSDALPGYQTVDEPYYLLEEEGHEFAEVPPVEDFELQLERSIECLSADACDVIFDRCPVDFLAYLLTHDDAEAFDLDEWLARARGAIEGLDIIVFVPVEDRERIALPRSIDVGWRSRVDEQLREILLESSWGLALDVLEVSGTPRARARQVLAYLRQARE